MSWDLLKYLNIERMSAAVRSSCGAAVSACEVGDIAQMLEQARRARQVAIRLGDVVGEAIALVCLGAASVEAQRVPAGITALDLATRILGRNRFLDQQHNEGVALFCTAIALSRAQPRDSTRIIVSVQKAVDLFGELDAKYGMVGDDDRRRQLHRMLKRCEALLLSELYGVAFDLDDFEVVFSRTPDGERKLFQVRSRSEAGSDDIVREKAALASLALRMRIIGLDRCQDVGPIETGEEGGPGLLLGSFVRDDWGTVNYSDADMN
jgi:hypothetical protein